MLTEAFALVEKNAERFYEAELYRLKGMLAFQSQTNPRQVPNKSRASSRHVQDSSKVDILQSAFPNPKLEEAEVCFLKAIEIARQQQARSLELRAVISLVRLRQHQTIESVSRNRQLTTQAALTAAHRILSEIYHWFMEGFETADLREAKRLLEELE